MGDGGVTCVAFLKGPFGCWGMGTDEGGGGRQKEEVEFSQLLASAAAFERNTSPRGNILPLWTSKYPQHPAAPRSGIANGTSPADSHSRPHRSSIPTMKDQKFHRRCQH